MKLVSTVSYAALLMSLGLAPMSAQAQDDDTGAEAFDLGTIVITARRTEEAIEDVPGSVVVATDEDLKGANIKRTDDLLLQFPNVNFTDGTTTTDLEISIRGLSDVNGAASTGPVNGIFLDGVLLNPTGSNLAINPRLLDLERVEVAFGPQGTAFGRGTIGGAINYVPKKPTDELEYTLGYELGSRADGEVRAIANVPILPDGKLSARVVAFAAFDDGFVPSVTLDDDLETDDYGVRLSLRSQLTDRFSLDFSASFDQTDFDSTRTATVASIEADDPINENSFFTDNQVERFFSSLRGTYEFDAGTLTANLSHADSNLDGGLDGDFSSIDFLSSDLFTETESTALEFRFEGNEFDLPGALGTLSYNAGVSLSDSITNTDSLSNVGPDGLLILGPLPLPAPVILGILGGAGLLGPAGAELGSFNVVSTNEVENFSIYGDLRWKPIEPLELTAGLRWSRDRVRANSESTSFGLVATGFAPLGIPTVIPSEPFEEETETFSAFTPSASVRYEWTDDFSTYFLFSTGFRPGGFTSAGTLPITPFDEERAKNFEIGFRSSFLENQVQLTGSFFFIDYDDIQVVSAAPSALALTGFETVIINADEAESYGAEITLAAQITNKLTLNASYGYNESEFSSFVDPILGDQTGNRLPNAPRHSVNVSAEYIEPVSFVRDGEAYFRADYTYRSDFISFLSPTAPVLDAYDVVDLRLGLRNESFLVEAFVENVFDEVYALGTTTLIFGDVAALEVGPTRRFGIRGEIRF